MKSTFLQASALGTILLFTGCSNTMTELPVEDISSKQVPDWYLDHETRSVKGWFIGEDKYYAAAVAVSPDMEMAIKKATLKAKAKISDRINGELNNRTTYVYDEVGAAEAMSGNMAARDEIVNIITDTILRTYGIKKREIIYNQELRNYRAFVLVDIPSSDIETLISQFEQDERIKQLVQTRTADVDKAIESFEGESNVKVYPLNDGG
jgi:hypothetical protein